MKRAAAFKAGGWSFFRRPICLLPLSGKSQGVRGTGPPHAGSGSFMVNLVWGESAEILMGTAVVVVAEVGFESGTKLSTVFVAAEVDVLVFDAAPEALDENVVEGAAATVHAGAHTVVNQSILKLRACELRTLIGIENFRRTEPGERDVQRIRAESGGECVGQLPCEDAPTVPVHDRNEIHKPLSHRYIRNV